MTFQNVCLSALVTFDGNCAAQKALDFFRNTPTSDVVAVSTLGTYHTLAALAALVFSPPFLQARG